MKSKFISKSAQKSRDKIIVTLEAIIDKPPSYLDEKVLRELKNQLYKIKYGWAQEDSIKNEIIRNCRKEDIDAFLLNGFIFRDEDGYFEIDHLFVNKFGAMHIIESKTFAKNSTITIKKSGEWSLQIKGFNQTIYSPIEQAEEAKKRLLRLIERKLRDRWPFQVSDALNTTSVVIPNETVVNDELCDTRVMRLKGFVQKIEAHRSGLKVGIIDAATIVAKSIVPLAKHLSHDDEFFEDKIKRAISALESYAEAPSLDYYLRKAGLKSKPVIEKLRSDYATFHDPKKEQEESRHCENNRCGKLLSKLELEKSSEKKTLEKYRGKYFCYNCRRTGKTKDLI